MAVTIKRISLYKDTWGQGKLKRNTDIIGLNVAKVNVEVEVEGSEFPAEIEIEIKTREPGNKFSKRGTVKDPVRHKLKRAGNSVWYLKQITLKDVATFWQAESGILEVSTVVRAGGTSDSYFRAPLVNKGWSLRGIGKQPGSPGGETGNDAAEQPDALKLLCCAGMEVIEVSVVKQPGWVVKQGKDWGYVRSPADVFYYSGHGAIWNGKIILHPDHEDWCSPEDILRSWKMKNNWQSPSDLDVLILNGCSLLNWEAKTGRNPMASVQNEPGTEETKNIGLRWAELMCTKKGPLWALLGFYDSAPLDDVPPPKPTAANPNPATPLTGNMIAAQFAYKMGELGHNWDSYAKAWLQVTAPTRAGAAIDSKGYWFTAKDGTIKGPYKLP